MRDSFEEKNKKKGQCYFCVFIVGGNKSAFTAVARLKDTTQLRI